jgi:hypothetical protein
MFTGKLLEPEINHRNVKNSAEIASNLTAAMQINVELVSNLGRNSLGGPETTPNPPNQMPNHPQTRHSSLARRYKSKLTSSHTEYKRTRASASADTIQHSTESNTARSSWKLTRSVMGVPCTPPSERTPPRSNAAAVRTNCVNPSGASKSLGVTAEITSTAPPQGYNGRRALEPDLNASIGTLER